MFLFSLSGSDLDWMALKTAECWCVSIWVLLWFCVSEKVSLSLWGMLSVTRVLEYLWCNMSSCFRRIRRRARHKNRSITTLPFRFSDNTVYISIPHSYHRSSTKTFHATDCLVSFFLTVENFLTQQDEWQIMGMYEPIRWEQTLSRTTNQKPFRLRTLRPSASAREREIQVLFFSDCLKILKTDNNCVGRLRNSPRLWRAVTLFYCDD